MSAVGQEYWLVAVGCSNPEEASGYKALLRDKSPKDAKEVFANEEKETFKKQLQAKLPRGTGPWAFQVPDGDRSLRHESFDSLIKLTDDLAKNDGQVETICHRFERQWLDLDPKASFKIQSRVEPKERPFEDYLKSWQWDEAKYPKSRSLTESGEYIMKLVNQNDEEARKKLGVYNDLKSQQNNLAKKDNASMPNRELIDVLTPQLVKQSDGKSQADDFIMTDYLTTVVVILARGQEKDFQNLYVTMQAGVDNKYVVPGSAKQFSVPDKEGHTVWRVVMTRANVEDFKKMCREKKFTAKDFEYSKDGFNKLEEQRKSVDVELKRSHEITKSNLAALWSDAMAAWMHIKAMRTFVETVLRCAYVGGMPLYFASFLVCPQQKAAVKMRKSLEEFAKGKPGSTPSFVTDSAAEAEEGEECFPYVSLSFTPFTVPRDGK